MAILQGRACALGWICANPMLQPCHAMVRCRQRQVDMARVQDLQHKSTCTGGLLSRCGRSFCVQLSDTEFSVFLFHVLCAYRILRVRCCDRANLPTCIPHYASPTSTKEQSEQPLAVAILLRSNGLGSQVELQRQFNTLKLAAV